MFFPLVSESAEQQKPYNEGACHRQRSGWNIKGRSVDWTRGRQSRLAWTLPGSRSMVQIQGNQLPADCASQLLLSIIYCFSFFRGGANYTPGALTPALCLRYNAVHLLASTQGPIYRWCPALNHPSTATWWWASDSLPTGLYPSSGPE